MELKEQSFEKREFKGLSLGGQDLCHKEFSSCVFKSCDFAECTFQGSRFIDCAFTCCNLSNVKVDNCSFRGVGFDDCKLVNVSCAAINPFLLSWVFKKCKIEMCNFAGLKMKHSRFIECVVWKTDFINVDLKDSDFSGCDLQGSRFHNAVLENVNFVGARNYYIDPVSNKVKNARFSAPEVLSLLAPFEIKIEQ